MKNIRDLVQPEEYETELFETIPLEVRNYTEMHPIESKFIIGLIRQLKPIRILEIGVAEGGSTCVLLNAIKDDKKATVTSVDIAEKCFKYPDYSIAFCVEKMFPEGNNQWTLYKGRDFSEICFEFEKKSFDFCIIDTAHLHPVESLNFLCVLPYLCSDAVVVFHDLSLFTTWELSAFPNICIANKLCYDTITGHKLKPKNKQYLLDNKGFSNLGAVQISFDTVKYIQNVFDMLYFPWSSFCVNINIKPIFKVVKKFYTTEQYEELRKAYIINLSYSICGYYTKYVPNNELMRLLQNSNDLELIFYGAGNICKVLLEYFTLNNLRLPTEIWDRNDSIKDVNTIPVVLPPFINGNDAKKNKSTVIVIAINDVKIANDVKIEILTHYPTFKVLNSHEFLGVTVIDEIPETVNNEGTEHLSLIHKYYDKYIQNPFNNV